MNARALLDADNWDDVTPEQLAALVLSFERNRAVLNGSDAAHVESFVDGWKGLAHLQGLDEQRWERLRQAAVPLILARMRSADYRAARRAEAWSRANLSEIVDELVRLPEFRKAVERRPVSEVLDAYKRCASLRGLWADDGEWQALKGRGIPLITERLKEREDA
jgi:hypothetical protein